MRFLVSTDANFPKYTVMNANLFLNDTITDANFLIGYKVTKERGD
jgi:hypothetical protein